MEIKGLGANNVLTERAGGGWPVVAAVGVLGGLRAGPGSGPRVGGLGWRGWAGLWGWVGVGGGPGLGAGPGSGAWAWLGWAALKRKLVYSKMATLCPNRKYELSNGQQQQAISIYFFLEGLGFRV